MPGLRQLHVAGSPLVRALVQGAVQPATVLAAFPTALYLHVPQAHGQPHCVVPVLTSDALLLPTGLVLARESRDVTWPVTIGDDVRVGAGRVDLGLLQLVVVRERRLAGVAAAPTPAPTPAPTAGHRGAGSCPDLLSVATPDPDRLAGACTDLVRAALDGEQVRTHVLGLVGAGPGLTPSGDDALCGVLLTLRALAPERLAQRRSIADAIRAAAHRTTCLSASLLEAAIDGYATPQVLRLLAVLVPTGPTSRNEPPIRAENPPIGPSIRPLGPATTPGLATALADVLAIGHSSGRDLVAGIAGTMAALSDHRDHPAVVLEGAPHG